MFVIACMAEVEGSLENFHHNCHNHAHSLVDHVLHTVLIFSMNNLSHNCDDHNRRNDFHHIQKDLHMGLAHVRICHHILCSLQNVCHKE